MLYRTALATLAISLAAAMPAQAQQVSVNSSDLCATFAYERLCYEVYSRLGVKVNRGLTQRDWMDGLRLTGTRITSNTPNAGPIGPLTVSPEPASLLLLATGLLGVGGALRARKREQE